MKDTMEFDFKRGDFVLNGAGNAQTVSGLAALKIWIEKILRTQYSRYKLYDGTTYGANIEDLTVGRSYSASYVDSELKREIKEALLKNEDITDVPAIEITRADELLTIRVSVVTVYGVREEAIII